MNLQEFINRRFFLNQEQEESLINLLTFGVREGTKRRIKIILKNQFYSKFDGNTYSKYFIIHDSYVDYIGKKEDINLIRRQLLGEQDD